MRVRWRKLITQILIWLLAELLLNFIGLDDLADYSEFLFERDVIILKA